MVLKYLFVNHFYHYLRFESLIYLLDSNCFPQVFSSIAWPPWSATTAFHLITWPRRRGIADHPWELWSNKCSTIFCSWQSILGKSWSSFWKQHCIDTFLSDWQLLPSYAWRNGTRRIHRWNVNVFFFYKFSNMNIWPEFFLAASTFPAMIWSKRWPSISTDVKWSCGRQVKQEISICKNFNE